ncbi:hypothetical protein LQW54_012897 [Pestalotiopsis sp. IQ-011]
MTTPRQITALLALPAALRPFVFSAAARAPSLAPQARCFHATCRAHARYLRRPLSVGAFVVPHSPTLPLSEIPIEELLDAPAFDEPLAKQLNTLFTKNPATFYHGTSDFYELKKNTRIPEICILGRSNVGKSTFVNALANRRDNELAHTSARAGRTKAMNAFGFGPAPTMKELADTDTVTKRTEDLPKHSFFVLDMPGYGHKSLQDWGKHINLYLNKRKSIKGAILLIDGEVGPKSGDLMALELLQEAGIKTAIVLTKADKAKHEDILKETCKNVWMTMRDVHSKDPNSNWEWDTDFFVTALGATKKEIGVNSVAIARLAVARLAGLITEKERPEVAPAKGYSGTVVSFEDLLLASSTAPKTANVKDSRKDAQTSQETTNAPLSGWTALEQAARDQHETRQSVGRVPPRASLHRLRRTMSRTSPSARQHSTLYHARQFSSTNPSLIGSSTVRRPEVHAQWRSLQTNTHGRELNTLSGREPLSAQELEAALNEFRASLKASETPMDVAERSHLMSKSDRPKHKIWDNTFLPPRENNKAKSHKIRATKSRHVEIYHSRLEREELRAVREKERKERQREDERSQKRGRRRQRDDMSHERDQEGMEEDETADGWDLIEAAQEKATALRGKKLKKATKLAEKQRRKEEKQKKRKGDEDEEDEDDDDLFESKFKSAR